MSGIAIYDDGFLQSNLSLIFFGGPDSKEVMRITPDGELIVHDPTEAAIALKREWERIVAGTKGERENQSDN